MRSTKVIALIILLSISIGFICAAEYNLVTNVVVSPNPMEKQTTVAMTLVKSAIVNISILTLEGDVVKTICDEYLSNGNYQFNWDRDSNDREYVPAGTYRLVISYGTQYTSIKKTLILK